MGGEDHADDRDSDTYLCPPPGGGGGELGLTMVLCRYHILGIRYRSPASDSRSEWPSPCHIAIQY